MRKLMFLATVMMCGAALPAAENPPDQRTPAQWAAQLGDADPAVRTRAAEALRQAGPSARAALEEAARADDAEVRARANALLDKLNVPLEVRLSTTINRIRAGQPLPPMTVTLHNPTRKPVLLLKPIDGSDCGWRVVGYSWDVTRDNGKVEVRPLGRCGNTNALTTADFVSVAAGKDLAMPPGKQGFLLMPDQLFRFDAPGRYRITLRYQFDPDRPERGEGKEMAPAVREMLREALKTDVVSEPLIIDVE